MPHQRTSLLFLLKEVQCRKRPTTCMSNVSVKTIQTLHSERSNRSFKNIHIHFKNLPQRIICEKNKITVPC